MGNWSKRFLRGILFSTLTLLLSLSTVGQEFEEIFYEGFENGGKIPTGWTQQFVFGSRTWRFENGGYAPSGAPTFRHPASAYAGSYNALFQDESIGPIRRLVTPAINLIPNGAATIKPTLTFWHAQDSWGGATDELKIYYRRSSSDGWVLIEHYTATTTNWTLREILLPDDAKTETCQIAFEGISNWGWGVCVDEVRIEERGRLDRKVEYFELKQKSGTIPSGSTVNPYGNILALVSGNNLEIPLNSITINYTGTSIADIDQVNVYHTRDSIFSVSSEIPADINISGNEITITAPTFNLKTGNNYIWFAFDISSEAEHGNSIDFSLAANSVLLGENSFPSTAQDPSSIATIHESLKFSNFSDDNTWTTTDLWEVGEPQGIGIYDPNYAFSGTNVLATNLSGDYPSNIAADSPETAISQPVNAKFYQNLTVRYRRWLNIEYFDKTSVKLSNNGGGTWQNIFQNSTAILDRSWQPISTDISQWATRKEDIRIMFSMDTTNQYTEYGGWNIDNFAITGEFIHSDVGISNATAPVQTCGLTNAEEVKVQLRNFGGATVDVPFDIGYSLNGGATYVREEYSIPLESEADQGGVYEVEYTFATTADFTSPGLKNLKFRTFLEGDQDASNDGYEKTIYVFPTVAYPYQTSFEGSNAYWYSSGTNSSWQWGTPTGTNIKTASDGNRVWATALSKDYNHNEKSYLESPCFDLSTAEMPVIAFDYIMQVEQGVDGLLLEYSIDGGDSWNLLPAHEHYAESWFDTPEVTALGRAGWSVNKTEYVTVKNLLPSDVVGVNGVKFRFVFGSDGTTRAEGVALDMIRVYELPYDVGITELVSPISACEIGKDVALELKLKNFGYRTVPQDAPTAIVVKVDGGNEKSEIITIPADIIQDGDYTLTTTNTFNMFSAGVHNIIAYTNLAIDDNTVNDTLKTTVEVLGMPEFSLGPDVGVEDFDIPVTLDAGAGYTSYSWYELPDEIASLGSNQTFDVNAEGDFKVFVTKYINEELTCEAEDDISVMLSTKDVGVAEITNLTSACEHDMPISPEIVIQSFRESVFDGIETIPLVVEVDGEIVLTEDYIPDNGWGTLNETIPYIFDGTIDLSEAKTYSISIYTNLSEDLDRNNDEESVSVTTFGMPEVIILTRTGEEPEVFETFSEIITTRADTLLLKANDGFNSYQWERKSPDETIWTSLASGQIHTPSSKNTNEYKVKVVDPNGCGTPETNNQVVLVNAYDLSLVSINNLTEEMCYTDELVVLSVTLKNSGHDNYPVGTEIAVSANTPMGNQSEIITLDTPLGIGEELVYEFPESVNLPVDENYLSFSATTANDPVTSNNELSITTTVHPTPTVTIEPSILYKVFDQYEAYEITPTYSEPHSEADVYTYIWHDGTVDSIYLVYNPTDYPIYEVTVENSFGCTASSSMTIVSADLQVLSIVSPFTDCGLTDETPVIVSIKNNGNTIYTTGTGIDVDLYLNGTLVVTETITLSEDFAAKSTEQFTLSQTLDLSAVTNATIQIDISSAAEEVSYDNNSRNKTVYALGFPSPNLGGDRDVHAWEEILDPGYYDAYLWNDGSTESELMVTEDGTYSVTVTDFSGCQGSDEVTLTFYIDDIELAEVVSPSSGCNLTDTEEVKVLIKNSGSFILPAGKEIEVGFTHNTTSFSETINLSSDLELDETLEVTLSQPLNLLERKAHEVTFFVDMDNDMREENNQLETTINSYANPIISLGLDRDINAWEEILTPGSNFDAYLWQDASTESTFTATETGNYHVTVTDFNGCEADAEVNLTFYIHDIMIADVVAPVSGCNLTDSEEAIVVIKNRSSFVLPAGKEIEVGFMHSTTNFSETINLLNELGLEETLEITLSQPLDLLERKVHEVTFFVDMENDMREENNQVETTIDSYANPTVSLGPDREVHAWEEILDPGNFDTYLWQDASTESTFTATQTGNYHVTVTDINGCEGNAEVNLVFFIDDIEIADVVAPVSGCDLTDAEEAKVVIKNSGSFILPAGKEIEIGFIHSTTNFSETINLLNDLGLNETVEITLSQPLNLLERKAHEVTFFVDMDNDMREENNQLEVIINSYANPIVSLGPDRDIHAWEEILDPGSGFDAYLWQDASTESTFTATQTGNYHVIVTDSNGCQGETEVNLTFYIHDIMIAGVVAPISGCELSDEEPVTITFKNSGTYAFDEGTTLSLGFTLDETTYSEELILAQVFGINEVMTVTLDETVDLSDPKTYNMQIWVEVDSDMIPENNNIVYPVDSYPPVDFSFNLPDEISTYLTYTLDAGPDFVSYLWQDGSTGQTFTATESGLYHVTVTDENGCTGYDEVYIAFNKSDINIVEVVTPASEQCRIPDMPIEITLKNERGQAIASGTQLTINCVVEFDTPIEIVETLTLAQTFNPNDEINYVFEQILNFQPNNEYEFTFRVDYDGVEGNSYEHTSNINPTPSVDLGPDTLAVEFPYTLIAGVGNVTYLWSNGSTSSSIEVYQAGKYWLTVTNNYGCSASDTIYLTDGTWVYEIPGMGNVKVYPNPVSDVLTVEVDAISNMEFNVELISPIGQKLHQCTINTYQESSAEINVQNYLPGLYLLRISSQGKWTVLKLIIN